MKKRAIIIVTPNCPNHDKLPGAKGDAAAWTDFLQSPEGGAWQEDEISVYEDPSKDFVNTFLESKRLLGLDYALLAFSGHGYYTKPTSYSTETRMLISDTDYLTENTFTVKARRELLIIDACRQYGGEVLEESINKMVRALNLSFANEDSFRRAREIYSSALSSTPEGRSLVFSCDLNQAAHDVSSFTRFLISDAIQLAKKLPIIGTISIKQAFDAAESKPSEVNYPQKPVFQPSRRTTHFPFSVSL